MPAWRKQTEEARWLPALSAWFATAVGRSLLAEETRCVNKLIGDCGGHYLLELGVTPLSCLNRTAIARRHFCMGSPGQQLHLRRPLDALCRFDELPVESDSQNTVVLHHLLEFAADPHGVLREVERVTVPHGKVIIVNFNPFSLLSLRMLAGRYRRNSPWQNHMLTVRRISDWLRLLGFEIDSVTYGFHRVPLERPRIFMEHGLPETPWLRKLPIGGTFLLSATKYRVPLTPTPLTWRRPRLVGARPFGVARGRLDHISKETV